VRCHSPSNRQGKVSLATPADLTAMSYIEPGHPDESYLLDLVRATAGHPPQMPKEGARLSGDQVAMLTRWIASGAVWPKDLTIEEKPRAGRDWWSLQQLSTVPPTTPDSREARLGEADWSARPIDRFVWAKLRAKGLQPSPRAERALLLRRVTYDLTGLPPSPEELSAFEADDAPLAYERVVDRLLASPHYGEHWGRHWLDVVRFGESRGFERNLVIDNAWPFRDYVIRSLNADKPFDRFVREHLAGDVIGRDQPDVEVGSAFLAVGPYDDVNNQDPVAAAQIKADTIDEIIRATGEAFLGMTIGCARCHDHKFDPLTARDYYALYATFAGVVHGERSLTTAAERKARLERTKPLEQELQTVTAERTSIEGQIEARAKSHEAELSKAWVRERASRYGTEERFAPVEAKYVRLRVEGNDLEDNGAGGGGRGFKLDEFEVWTGGVQPRNVALASAGGKAKGAARNSDDSLEAYSAALTIDGKFGQRWLATSPELIITLPRIERIERVFFSSDRTQALDETSGITTFVGDYTIETSLDGKQWKAVADSSDRQPATPLIRNRRLRRATITPEETARLKQFDRRQAEIDAALAKLPAPNVWWVGKRREAPGPFHVFSGGDPQKHGDIVVAASFGALDKTSKAYRLDAGAEEAQRRVTLAEWIASDDNPLTPRVLVNRLWHYHFGVGLVDTPSDFGFMGGRPSHPELLDHLARQLIAGDWRLKPLHREIVLSETYRQASTWREDAARLDHDDRLLWRYPPRRLDAEELRDSMLAIAGKLDRHMGGPGFRLYRYQSDNVSTYTPLDEHGPETYRRAVYHQNARASRIDLLTEFDSPDCALAAPRRGATTTPLQALTLLNHRFTLDMARALAERLVRQQPGDVEAQVELAFVLVTGQKPSPDEGKEAAALVRAHGLEALGRALFNANSLVFVR